MPSLMSPRFHLQGLLSYSPSLPSMGKYFSSTSLLHPETSPSVRNEDVERVFAILTAFKDPESLKQSLKTSQNLLSNELIERVLKRARFSHSDPMSAFEFYKLTSTRFFHTPFSFDTMLFILGRSRRFVELWQLLLDTKKKDKSLITLRTVQVVLAKVAKVSSVMQTVAAFKRFRRLVPVLDVSCFNALLKALCQEKSMTDARNVYNTLKHEFKPNLQTFNILLSGCKSSEEAEAYFSEMREMGIEPDIVSYNCMVNVYCKGGDRELRKAYDMINKMRNDGIDLDVITYTSLIGGLGLAGQPDKARDVLKEMKEYGCYPDVASYTAVIKNFCIARRLTVAYNVMDEMVEKGLSPNVTTYTVIFRSLFRADDLKSSWSLYHRMRERGCLPNTESCMYLIRLMRKHEKADMALELWNDMVDKGFGSCTLFSDVLFDLLCVLGRLQEAERCFLQMLEKRQKPSNVSFKRIEVVMELDNKHEALSNLSEKMCVFGSCMETYLCSRSRLLSPSRHHLSAPPCPNAA